MKPAGGPKGSRPGQGSLELACRRVALAAIELRRAADVVLAVSFPREGFINDPLDQGALLEALGAARDELQRAADTYDVALAAVARLGEDGEPVQ